MTQWRVTLWLYYSDVHMYEYVLRISMHVVKRDPNGKTGVVGSMLRAYHSYAIEEVFPLHLRNRKKDGPLRCSERMLENPTKYIWCGNPMEGLSTCTSVTSGNKHSQNK